MDVVLKRVQIVLIILMDGVPKSNGNFIALLTASINHNSNTLDPIKIRLHKL